MVLFASLNSRISIQGRSVSYEAVNLFVDVLGKSDLIDTADLIGTERDEGSGGFISYSIVCSLISEGT